MGSGTLCKTETWFGNDCDWFLVAFYTASQPFGFTVRFNFVVFHVFKNMNSCNCSNQ